MTRRADRNISKIRIDTSTIIFRIMSYLLIGFFAIVCLLPFAFMISGSFTSEKSIIRHGYQLFPRETTLRSYIMVLENPDILLGSYIVSVSITSIGTFVGLFLIAMTGYTLVRKDFPLRNHLSFFIYFTTLFQGGIVPFYLLIVRYFHLRDNYLAVLLPLLMSPWLVILMKNFTKSVPDSISESAKMDGAGDFQIFINLILPMSKPALASLGLFLALSYWNEWYYAMLFLSPNMKYRPLQLLLYNIIAKADFLRMNSSLMNVPPQDIPNESLKMATAVVATGPIILVYPFVQKYFVKGITIGAVKG